MQQDEKVEVAVILDTDTIIDPLTVMIKSFYALVANVAMSGVGRANHLTFRAEQVGFEFLNETHKGNI